VKFVNARALVGRAFANALRPPEALTPAQWAAKNLIVPDGPQKDKLIDFTLTPYLVEPLEMLGPDSPANEIAVMKGAQTGFTLMLLAAIGYIVDRAPCNAMLIEPTASAAAELNRGKLEPVIKASAALRAKVAPQTSRSTEGSTTYSKRFPGGSLTLAIASSAADLRSRTIKYLLRDEIDEYVEDLDGQGDPLKISDARLISFLASGDWRKADVSTPTIKGSSAIERRYLAGDQRRWHVPCPHCDGEFVFEFGPQFRHEPVFPFKAHYVAPCCGSIIEGHEKRELVARGRWVPTATRPGAFPSYHFDALSSPLVPWGTIAAESVAVGDDPARLKTFHNLMLGLPFEVRGDAPEFARLMERREEGLKRGHVPPRGVILTAAADVQMRGVWYEVVAWAPNRESWVVEADYIDGSTETPCRPDTPLESGNAFAVLMAKVFNREFPDAFGRTRRLDALGIDTGYRSHIVYATVRANQRINPGTGQGMLFPLDGRDGWNKPAIGGSRPVDILLDGTRVPHGTHIWPVGTWPLKSAFYADLRKEGLRAGAEADPPGYCHFPAWLDEAYFRQVTAEYIAEETFRGRVKKRWRQRAGQKDNHFLDCRVYNMALAEHLGLSSLSPAEWAALARERGAPPDLPLFTGRLLAAPGAPAAVEPGTAPEAPEAAQAAPALAGAPARDYGAESLDEKIARLMKKNNAGFGSGPRG
jgi:phage terminase large subunit GpA-like protein